MASLISRLFEEIHAIIKEARVNRGEGEYASGYNQGYLDALSEIYDILVEYDDDEEEEPW
jgi:hypothetical protein